MGQPHYIIQLPMLACGKRDAMVMAPPPMPDSAVLSCFYGCLSFLHRHFPPQSCPSHALGQSLHNQQQLLPWDCCTIPKLQLPATAPSRGPVSLSGVSMATKRTVWFSFPLGCHRSTVSLSALNVSPLTQTIAPTWGADPYFRSPTHRGWSDPSITPVFPPSFFILLSFVWFYIFFTAGQVTPVCPQMLFCMHFCVWRCIPDVSVQRDILHAHLLIRHLVPFQERFFKAIELIFYLIWPINFIKWGWFVEMISWLI